jgi:plasmid replication initiation protein
VIRLQKEKSIKKTNKVTKSNDLIQSTHRLTLQENRIISTLISMIEPTDKHFQIYKFSVKDFQDMIGVKGNMHAYIKRIVTGLQEKTLAIPTGDSTLVVNWLASAEYFDNDGYIELEISNKLKPYLLGLKERFTSYHLQYILRLNSFYSMRLYELLKQYQFIKFNKKQTELDALRNWLGFIDEYKEKYIQYGHFNAKVLKVAEKEINEKTDITFSYKEIKKGKKVVAIEFTIQNKGSHYIEPQDNGEAESNLKNEVDHKNALLTLGVSSLQIKRILNEIPLNQIERNIDLAIRKRVLGEIDKNIGGFTYKAIMDDYASNEEQAKKKPIRQEKIPESIVKGDEEERIITNGTLAEKQQLYLANQGSQEEQEKRLLKMYDLKIRLAKSLLDIGEKEEQGKQQLREEFEKDINNRLTLQLPLLKEEDFKDLLLRQIYVEIFAEVLEPIN